MTTQTTPERIPLFGLDLGKRADPSALIGGYRETRPDGEHAYHFRFAHQWRLGTPYREVRADLLRVLTDPQIDPASAALALDMTGVGEAIAEEVIAECPLLVYPIWITGGNGWRFDAEKSSYNVGKSVLVSSVGALFASGRITFARTMKETPLLLKELDEFKVKISKSANELYEAREGVHDDLVLAVALACWMGENVFLGSWNATPPESARSEISRARGGVFLEEEDARVSRYIPKDD